MANIEMEGIDEEDAERILDSFLEPYLEQGIGEQVQIDIDTSIENKASVAYYIVNGDFSESVQNNVDYNVEGGSDPEVHNFSSFREILEYADSFADDIDYDKHEEDSLTEGMDFKPW